MTIEAPFTDTDLAWFRRPIQEPTLAQEADHGGLLWVISFNLLWVAVVWVLLGVATGGCVNMPHVAPAPRAASTQAAAVVAIFSSCTEADPFNTPFGVMPGHQGPDIDWGSHSGTGVVISERHILTAAHVVACPIIPVVHVLLSSGRVTHADVEMEDDDADVARLEMAYADNFNLHIAPPILSSSHLVVVGERLCARAGRKSACGYYDGSSKGQGVFGAFTGPGWSGSGVYDEGGRLVGLVTAGNALRTWFAFVDAKWLEGT